MSDKKRLYIEIKETSEQEFMFEGLLSPYGNVDSYDDIVEPGAFTKTIQEHNGEVPLMKQHSRDEYPIGKLFLEDREYGLWCKGWIDLDDPKGDGRQAYHKLKTDMVKGLSIGYQSVKDSIENGIRHLKEIRLFEGSLVTFPANPLAQVMSVKKAIEVMDSTDYEAKVGAAISAVTAARLKSACEKILTAHNEIAALCEDKAGSATLSDKAAEDNKPEPAGDHSAIVGIIESMRSLIPK